MTMLYGYTVSALSQRWESYIRQQRDFKGQAPGVLSVSAPTLLEPQHVLPTIVSVRVPSDLIGLGLIAERVPVLSRAPCK